VGSGGRDVTAAMSLLKIQSSEASPVACAAAIGGMIASAIVQASRVDDVPADTSASVDATVGIVACTESGDVVSSLDGSSTSPVGANPALLSDDVWLSDVLASDFLRASTDVPFDELPMHVPPARVGAVYLSDDEDLTMPPMDCSSIDFDFDPDELFDFEGNPGVL
jgi:hypothetical protein